MLKVPRTGTVLNEKKDAGWQWHSEANPNVSVPIIALQCGVSAQLMLQEYF